MSRVRTKPLMIALMVMIGLVLAMPAAGQDSTRSISISRDCKVGDQTLAKGGYTIRFSEAKDGELVFLRGKNEVAKVAYKLSKLGSAPKETVVVFTLAGDGSYRIKRIEIKGLGSAILLE
jgi:hypothetical protein